MANQIGHAQTPVSGPADVLERLLSSRYSCRSFRPEEIPRPDIERMLQAAQKTASWCNVQPWQTIIVSGQAKHRLAAALTDHARAGQQQPDLQPPLDYRGVYQDRRRASGYALYNSLGISRDDIPGRQEQMLENFRFFGAPHAAIITTDRYLGAYGAVDCGAYVATLLLVAESLGIATVAQAAIAMCAPAVREELQISEDRQIVCAVSFGYEDKSHPANNFRTSRADLAQSVQWVDGAEP
ncbi:nitroreductase [Arthrobacter sp. W4I7]|uniref:nitroreductase n=1 Tax=Arthrobacter sp. W4I7 TaxID=3042296 RepID=UPI002786F0BA|nr:nitroreductase [Arthrobacter sp. W4I7]MDQ0691389.1 nitroreductase [Arthrobacter sp. W4I7]